MTGIQTRSDRVFKTVGFFCAVAEEAVLELCDTFMHLLFRKKKEEGGGRESICVPAWTLKALARQKGGNGVGGTGGSCLLSSVVFA